MATTADDGVAASAREAAAAMAGWLRRRGVEKLLAHIHPEHSASQAVAHHLSLTPTDTLVEGEVRWIQADSGTTHTE